MSVLPAPVADPAGWRGTHDMSPDGPGRIEPNGTEVPVRMLGKPLLALPAVAAFMLLPWTVGLAALLPHRIVAYHWNTAWTGLDVAIAIGLALTSWLGHRRDARAALAAAATTALMCTDSWFDMCTSAPGRPFAMAAAEAALELMVAAACLTIGLRTRRYGHVRPLTAAGTAPRRR